MFKQNPSRASECLSGAVQGSSSFGEAPDICRLQMAEPEPAHLSGPGGSQRGQWEGHIDVTGGTPARSADLAERCLLLWS